MDMLDKTWRESKHTLDTMCITEITLKFTKPHKSFFVMKHK